jgi:hypothetical protein
MRYISKRCQYPCCILNEIRIIRILLIIEDHSEMKPIIHEESLVSIGKTYPKERSLEYD